MKLHYLLLSVGIILIGSNVYASYILTPLSDGQDTLVAHPGDSLTLDLVLTSDAADTHNALSIDVTFSQPRAKI